MESDIFPIPLKVGNVAAPINDPKRLDLNAVCILMCTLDLLLLLGIIARPTNQQIIIKDDDAFNNYNRVTFDPVVVKFYDRNNE